MAKVIKTERGETIHTVQFNQREIDIIIGLLGQCWCREETAVIHDNLKPLREEYVRYVDGQGDPLPTLMISKEENKND